MTLLLPVPPYQRRMQGKLGQHVEALAPLLSPRPGNDKRGTFVTVRGNMSVLTRARGLHEPGSWHWYETEAAKLACRTLIADRDSDRSLVHLWGHCEYALEDEILSRAKLYIPHRLAQLRGA